MSWDDVFKSLIAAGQMRFGPHPSESVLNAVKTLSEYDPAVLNAGLHAVDVGAGEGRHSKLLADLGFKVTALELSQAAAEHYSEVHRQEGYDQIEWVNSPYQEWTPDEPLDVLLAAFFHHTDGGIKVALSRFDSWLRPGGYILMAGHSRAQSGPNARGPRRSDMLWDYQEISSTLQEMGYEVIKAEDVPRDLPTASGAANHFPPALDTIVVARKPVA
ncbi:class I SAM-dependent methyltransferase [Boudabousia marimammalium]|uniref:Methyltransferase domain-containing protein n=1 Tax=Boudabousia marimammalium TaxID=156892 RepID=A0A1Q5PL64_9ACTO|nr:class I SAM-dependent methyltransferase [Boudabousia marimammalium]OKL47370.1 hypothetical protein BM477_06805 [Boudabousia marimammalium]